MAGPVKERICSALVVTFRQNMSAIAVYVNRSRTCMSFTESAASAASWQARMAGRGNRTEQQCDDLGPAIRQAPGGLIGPETTIANPGLVGSYARYRLARRTALTEEMANNLGQMVRGQRPA